MPLTPPPDLTCFLHQSSVFTARPALTRYASRQINIAFYSVDILHSESATIYINLHPNAQLFGRTGMLSGQDYTFQPRTHYKNVVVWHNVHERDARQAVWACLK